jgi:hypothetical protein
MDKVKRAVEKRYSVQERKKIVTLFMIIIFSMLLAATSGIANVITRLFFQVLLFFGQIVIVKTLLDDYYQ